MKSDFDIPELGLDWILPGRLAVLACPDEAGVRRLARMGVKLLISLNEYPPPTLSVRRAGMRHVRVPLADGAAPSLAVVEQLVGVIGDALGRDEAVAVHCDAGIGRAGTVVACYVVSCGYTPQDAIEFVRSRRPGAVENEQQELAVRNWWRRLHGWETTKWL
ncbi:MAG: dual specificity protein phosphatase family protein [Armatimonadetes bacterium]|nr:dual specificity protein phosphatase family protein [Armatimonadota bacterium]